MKIRRLRKRHRDPEVAQYLIGVTPALVNADIARLNIAMLVGHWQLRGFGSQSS